MGSEAPSPAKACPLQAARSALAMVSRAARNAGSRPPQTPMTTAKMRPETTAWNVMRKANASSAKLGPPVAVESPLAGVARLSAG